MKAEEYIQIKNMEWFEKVSIDEAAKYHKLNVERCLDAIEYHKKEDRPINILAVYGSGRSNYNSCAQELSNSQLLLRGALEQFRDNPKYEIVEIPLRSYNIEPCNNCYATSSALCGFPCNCFPLDPMQDLYPLVLKCDVMLCATGVNQSDMSSRLKTFLDRLISLDGGFYVTPEQFGPKDYDWRDKCIALATELSKRKEVHYDARMWGRTSAYFISSKDEKNDIDTVARDYKELDDLSYIERVAAVLREGQADYGFFHDKEDWYAGAYADPNVEMAYDKKTTFSNPEFAKRAELVARKAVELAEKIRKNPIPFDGGGRGKTRT